jgi:hypothetical protein
MKKELEELWEFLAGKKTYIVMFAGVGLATLKYFDLIDPKLYNFILDVLAFLGLGAIRDAVNTILKDCVDSPPVPPEIPLPPVTIRK